MVAACIERGTGKISVANWREANYLCRYPSLSSIKQRYKKSFSLPHLQIFDILIYFELQSTLERNPIAVNRTFMITQNQRRTGIVLTVALLLLIPLIVMQFSEEVNWSLSDFIVAGVLLLGAGLLLELVVSTVSQTGRRIAIGLAILVVFLLIWAELAVGIFGTPFAGT